ncbi:DUF4876 domain-containing protein [Flavobacterium sp. LHD-85]|uniref:DUF4876 domain-containing protein n=1 Tax=Flavobacterium sp. LHD-85 TaxID=3071410 RepID=UPI0027E13FAA|nr:DUF4876 domain-containing protein [Flavobacterium sp. LHD-85]MDQ6530966.1 DUF4876 domain-containing protein [Flavobacterium sp. LHD-85]
MKNIILLFAIAVTLFSCTINDDFGGGTNLQPVTFTVNLKYDKEQYNGLEVNTGNVVLTNTNTGDSYTATSTAAGIASFANILPGTYNVTATKAVTSEEFFNLFQFAPTTATVTFNGSQEKIIVNANIATTNVELKAARIGDLVIKQIYYAGSHASQGAVFRDQFIEIYNNSNEVIYADGLYLGQLYGKINITQSAVTLANGQYDWSKSIGMTAGADANTKNVYADYVMRIPGTGMQYPIKPGESIVIAQTAINHKSPLVDNTGIPLSVKNPDLTVDLSAADFEVYLGDYLLSKGKDVFRYDIQNPAVKDLEIAYWGRAGYDSGNQDFLMDNPGRDSFVIFRADNFDKLLDYSDPSITVIDSKAKFFVQIPTKDIIDGVDLQNFNPSAQRPKMLPSEIDASFTNCDAAYNSQSVIRKTKSIVNGRRILEDTNNSASDFVKLAMANPKGFAN